MTKPAQTYGPVSLIGAGPGDPELLTVKALRRLEAADVVLHDRLVSPAIIALCAHARCINVGKMPRGEQTSQEVINHLLLKESRGGKRVVRLKGGDPFVFGRGSEEAIFLRAHGVTDVELVPGISSCISAPELAGIPVTHRGLSTHFSVVTGMGVSRGTAADIAALEASWVNLALAGGTVVFLMSVRKLPRIVELLLDAGVTPTRPIGIVQAATRDAEQVVTGSLSNIVHRAQEADVQSPATIVLGEVVGLRDAVLGIAERAQATQNTYSRTSRIAASNR